MRIMFQQIEISNKDIRLKERIIMLKSITDIKKIH